jgi:hypothetical protein
MRKGSDSVPSLVASRFSLTVFVKYEASFASDFDLGASCFWGMKLLLLLWGT